MAAIETIDQLCRQPYSIAHLAHAAFQHVADAEYPPNFAYIPRLPLEHKARIASYDHQLLYFRKRGNHIFGDTVGEILLVGIVAHVLKRKHGDGRLVRQWRGRSQPIDQRAICSRAYSVSADRLGDVLELLLAPVLEANVQLALDLAVHLFGNQDSARIGAPLQPDRHVAP